MDILSKTVTQCARLVLTGLQVGEGATEPSNVTCSNPNESRYLETMNTVNIQGGVANLYSKRVNLQECVKIQATPLIPTSWKD